MDLDFTGALAIHGMTSKEMLMERLAVRSVVEDVRQLTAALTILWELIKSGTVAFGRNVRALAEQSPEEPAIKAAKKRQNGNIEGS